MKFKKLICNNYLYSTHNFKSKLLMNSVNYQSKFYFGVATPPYPNERIRNKKVHLDDLVKDDYEGRVLRHTIELLDDTRDIVKPLKKYCQAIKTKNTLDLLTHTLELENKLQNKVRQISIMSKVSPDNIKSMKILSLEKFDEIKSEILKKYPDLIKYDFEHNLNLIKSASQRIDYITENFIIDHEEEYFNFFDVRFINDKDNYKEAVVEAENSSKIPNFENTHDENGNLQKLSIQRIRDFEVALGKRNVEMTRRMSSLLKNNETFMKYKRAWIRLFENEKKDDENSQKIEENIGQPFYPTENQIKTNKDLFDKIILYLANNSTKHLMSILTKEECEFVVKIPYRMANFKESLIYKKHNEYEFALGNTRGFTASSIKQRYDLKEDDNYNYQIENFNEDYYLEKWNAYKVALEHTYKTGFINQVAGYEKTTDNKRIDVGLILMRKPIFLQMNPKEIEYIKYKSKFSNKYAVDLSKMKQDIYNFPSADADNERPFEKINNSNPYNIPDIRKLKIPDADPKPYLNSYMLKDNQPDDPYNMYCSTSKHFMRVDPTIEDNKNIQTYSKDLVYFIYKNKFTNKWELPTYSLESGYRFRDGLEVLTRLQSGLKFSIYFPGEPPVCMIEREFSELEKNDEKNRGLYGVRTFYFKAYHDRGQPYLDLNDGNNFNDFMIVKKDQLKQYFTEEYYNLMVPYLK